MNPIGSLRVEYNELLQLLDQTITHFPTTVRVYDDGLETILESSLRLVANDAVLAKVILVRRRIIDSNLCLILRSFWKHEDFFSLM